MKVAIEIRPFATLEIIEAYKWYESGLGLDFLNELDIFYKALERNPSTHAALITGKAGKT